MFPCFVLFSCLHRLAFTDTIFISSSVAQVPERARGYLFEYELLSVNRSGGATMQYTNRIYKPMATSFETFKETEDAQQMSYPTAQLDESHEIWQQALGRCNARDFIEREQLKAATSTACVISSVVVPLVDVSDIDDFFQLEGKCPKLLEFEFIPGSPDPTVYTEAKTGRKSSFWFWNHKITDHQVKRFASSSGKSFDTGVLTKYLRRIKKNLYPTAWARAQHILQLSDNIKEPVVAGTVPWDRKNLLLHQVSCVCSPSLHFF